MKRRYEIGNDAKQPCFFAQRKPKRILRRHRICDGELGRGKWFVQPFLRMRPAPTFSYSLNHALSVELFFPFTYRSLYAAPKLVAAALGQLLALLGHLFFALPRSALGHECVNMYIYDCFVMWSHQKKRKAFEFYIYINMRAIFSKYQKWPCARDAPSCRKNDPILHSQT